MKYLLALFTLLTLSGCLSAPNPVVGTWDRAESSSAGSWGNKIVTTGGEKSITLNEDKTAVTASGKTGHWAEPESNYVESKYIKFLDADGIETIYYLETPSSLYYLGTMDEADSALNGLLQGYSLGTLIAKDEIKILVRYRKSKHPVESK
jgi:hypothetical protein